MPEFTFVQKIAIWVIPLIFAITLHEVAHGLVASWFGDKTAKLAGRLSLDPLKHIDPIGTVIVPILMLLVSNFIFGWAKPVPVDSRNMRNPRFNMLFVALAGPFANILMALCWAGIAKVGMMLEGNGNTWFGTPLMLMGGAGIMINTVLAVLNLLPIPPLDGAQIVESLLPPRIAYAMSQLGAYGFFILILLIITGLLSTIIGPPIFYLINLISSLFGLA
jgi:Zn-dependent protease